jgi:hypothetical protein
VDGAVTASRAFGRLYTHAPLWEYGEAARRALEPVLRAALARGPGLVLRRDAFREARDEDLTSGLLGVFLADLAGGRVESFAIFRRPASASSKEDPMPFLLRIDREPHWGVYYKHKAWHESGKDHVHPGGGECIEVGLAPSPGDGGDTAEATVALCRELFLASQAVYGYVSTGTPREMLQRASPLEARLELFRRLKERPWIEEYRDRVAGVFRANFLGPSLRDRISLRDVPPEVWTCEDLGPAGVLVRLREEAAARPAWESSLEPALGPLLPKTPAARRPLPSPIRRALLLDAEAVRRLGGAGLVGELPADEVRWLPDGGAVVVTELASEFDDYLLNQFLWPLRPGRRSPGYVELPAWAAALDVAGEMTDPVSEVRVRVRAADLEDARGLAVHLEFGGKSGPGAAARAREVLVEWLGPEAAVALVCKRQVVSGRVRLPSATPETVLAAALRLRALSVRESSPFVWFLGDFDAETVQLSRGFLKGKGFYTDL